MRRGMSIRFLFIAATCGVIIVGLHFYMYIYKRNLSVEQSRVIMAHHSDEKAYLESGDGKRMKPSSVEEMAISNNEKSDLSNSLDVPFLNVDHDPRSLLKEKIVHLDLKGMPFKVEAYKELFPFFASLGVTGLLIEYEDMFPYSGQLLPIRNKKAYSVPDIKTILDLAKSNGLEVIPLIQTFGHLEFLLKVEEFRQLREVPKYMQVLCPTNASSQPVIREMIDQVMALHPDIKSFHIGSDEVYYIGKCPLCQDKMNKLRIQEPQLFLEHVKSVAQYVKDKHFVKPLMWDDEFRSLSLEVIQASGIGDLVEIVVWNYNSDIENRIPLEVWQKYSSVFKSVWIGTAFKGANKPNSIVANETLYLANHYSWLKTMASVDKFVSFKGVMLTGWQRYDHFSVLCEIFPAAIPSLTANLKLLTLPKLLSPDVLLNDVSGTLKCNNFLNFCTFPGSKVHTEIHQLEYYKSVFSQLKKRNVFLGWAQDLNTRTQFSNPSLIEPILQEVTALKAELDRCQKSMLQGMHELFPEWSIEEWMMTNFNPFYNKVGKLYDSLTKILEKQTFPVRPFSVAQSDDL